MELLGVLEKKIENLVEVVLKLRVENERLSVENKGLSEQVDTLKQILLKREEDFKSQIIDIFLK